MNKPTRKPIDDLGFLQKKIMETVWAKGEATARQVLERVSGKKKPLAYTSVLSIMQKLEKLGWLKHRVENRTNIYQATFSHRHENTRSLKKFTQSVFQGNSRLLFQHLIEDEDFKEEDLLAFRKMIDQKRKEKKDV